jgi:chromate transporter
MTEVANSGTPERKEPLSPSLGALVRYFLTLGTFGFGGPIALAGYMQRHLVEERRWFTAVRSLHSVRGAPLA